MTLCLNSVSQYPKDHQDLRSELKKLETKSFEVSMAKFGDEGKVTNRQSVHSKNTRVPLEPLDQSQAGGIRVGLEWDCTKSNQQESLYRI